MSPLAANRPRFRTGSHCFAMTRAGCRNASTCFAVRIALVWIYAGRPGQCHAGKAPGAHGMKQFNTDEVTRGSA